MSLSALKIIVSAVLKRNKIILSNFSHLTEKKKVNLHWWKINKGPQNVGDYLSTVVFEYMKSRNGLGDNCRRTRNLYAIGSIIDGGYQNATVWGSGLLRGKEKYWWSIFRKLDVRSVRGPKTREALIKNGYKVPEIYGDPAILMPLIYSPLSYEKCYDYLLIPHFTRYTGAENEISMLSDDWKAVIDKIVMSRLVICSSLHGIILAEAYGVPAILLNDHEMNLFKYEDYYYSTGRFDFPVAKNVEEALKLAPPPLPDFTEMRESLVSSFPYDLWE